jgi:hypothetical protein
MLIFIDTPKFFRVFRLQRSPDDAPKRVRIGRLMKAGYEFHVDDGFSVDAEERAQIDSVAETLKDADAHLLRADALRFPEIARRTREYYVNHATDVEKQLIATAAIEITRAVRKADKQGEEESLKEAVAHAAGVRSSNVTTSN